MSAALDDDVCDTTAHATQLPARTGTPDIAAGTCSAVRSACTRQKDASSLRVLVLIGVACAFDALVEDFEKGYKLLMTIDKKTMRQMLFDKYK